MAWAGEGEAGEVDKGRERGSRNRGGGLMMRWVDVYVLRGKAEGWGGWRLEGGEREEGGGGSEFNERSSRSFNPDHRRLTMAALWAPLVSSTAPALWTQSSSNPERGDEERGLARIPRLGAGGGPGLV